MTRSDWGPAEMPSVEGIHRLRATGAYAQLGEGPVHAGQVPRVEPKALEGLGEIEKNTGKP